MIIGIDIDGVLIDDDTYILDHMSKYCFENELPFFSNPYKYEKKCNFDEITLNDYREKYFFSYIKNAPIKSFASEIIEKLHKENNKIVIITSRYKTTEDSIIGKQMRNDTINWLNKNNVIYDKICFSPYPKTKDIQNENVDIMIEDNPNILPKISLFTKVLCFDNRYNRDLKLDNMTRVFSWYDIYTKIKRINYELNPKS